VAGYEVSCLATARPRLLTSFTNENGAASGLGLTVVDVSAKINPNLYTTKTNNDSYGDGLDVVLAICIASTAMILLIFPCLMAWHENRQYNTKSSERTTLQVKISRMCLKPSRQFTCFLALLLAFTYVFLFRHFQMLGPISSTASINTQISALTLLSNVSNKEMTLHPSHQTALFRKKDVMNLSIDCTWSPTLEQPCLSLLSKRLKFVKRIREWIYFGDSTMAGTFKHMAETCLNHLKSKGINCTSSKASRCKNNEFYGLSIKENWSWVPPSEFEGPKTNGVKFPNCMDCSTCFTNIWNCNNPSNKMPSFYGVEFARDVELQSREYNTTQENVVLSLKKRMKMEKITGQETVCILNVGLHDMALLTLTDLKFYENIMWYFSLLDPVCAHFVWVHSTLLRDDKIEPFCPNQTNPRIRKWNRVVSQMLSKSPQFQSKTTIVDVEEASKNFPHNDRVHLKYLWYKALGGLFYKLYNQRM